MVKKKKKMRFFSSIYVKIATVFVLLLLIFVEIVGALFIRDLEKTTINNYETSMNEQVESLATNLSTCLENKKEDADGIKSRIRDFTKNNILEVRVMNNKGIILATTNASDQDEVGKKDHSNSLNELMTKKQYVDSVTKRRVYVNVQPIYSPNGDAVIGAVYVKSDLEGQYEQVRQTSLIFIMASLVAMFICLVIAIIVARQLTKPIGEMQQQAARIAKGDYSDKVRVYGKDELGELGETFNELSERVAEAQETSESERHRLDSVLSHMTDGVLATDRRGRIIIINEMAQLMLNITSEQAMGKSILDVLKLHDDYSLRSLLEVPSEVMITVDDYDGTVTRLKADFSLIHHESGFIGGVVCVLHDVTEQEKNEQERRDFVSNVSHELRTPLTSMRSYLEALNDGAWKDPEVAPEFLRVTQEETERMIRMISDLLSLSRIDSQRSQLQPELINLNEMMGYILDRFDMMIQSNDLPYHIVRDFTKRSIWVEVDNDKLMQVFDNILNNALKYSPDGGTITVRLHETHQNVVVSISDEGLGIPKKDLNKVFDRFYRVDKARSRAMGGTGLGLAIAKEVVKQHRGRIWVESEEGKGSTFYISLPYESIEDEEELW